MNAKFEVGKAYGYNVAFTVTKRTEKFVTYTWNYYDEVCSETKKIAIDKDGNEYVKGSINASVPYKTDAEKEAEWEAEEQARLEAERKARHEVKIVEGMKSGAPETDGGLILNLCLKQNIKALVDKCASIRMICCGVCANPEMNSASYGLSFNGNDMYVILRKGMNDTTVESFCNKYISGQPCILKNGLASFEISPAYNIEED